MRKPHRLVGITDNDSDLLRKIFFSSWDRALAFSPLSPESKQQILNQQFELQQRGYQQQYPHADYSLIYLKKNPAGRIYVDRGPNQLVLIDITLFPSYRRQGLGTTIILELLEEAQSAQKPVYLHVEKWNPEARRLYHRLGFEDLEDIDSHWKMGWTPLAPSQGI